MKKLEHYLPTVILLYFIGLLSFNTSSNGAAIGLIVSASLFSYYHYMSTVKNPDILKKLAETEARLKHDYKFEVDKLKEEASKLSITLSKMPMAQKQEQIKQKIQF